MTAKRFTTDNGSNEDVCLVDNLTKKEYESNFNDIVDLMNKIWEQTQRFEKHNKDLTVENEKLKARLYAEKTNTAEVINDYAKQFKRNSTQFSFMVDLAEDLGIDISKLEALDD